MDDRCVCPRVHLSFSPPDHRLNPSDTRRNADPIKGPTFQILHMTDVHLDPEYLAGQDVECSFPLCCRQNEVQKRSRLSEGSGEWGSLEGNCDCPSRLAHSALKAINESISRKSSVMQTRPEDPLIQSSSLGLILWTGDILPHNVWSTSKEQIRETATEWTRMFREFLGNAGVPVVPVLGNHEELPVNM